MQNDGINNCISIIISLLCLIHQHFDIDIDFLWLFWGVKCWPVQPQAQVTTFQTPALLPR